MKRFFCIKFIALICMCLTLTACPPGHVIINPINFVSNGANLIVANITTGEQMENKGLQIGIERLIAHPGDVLRISYNKPDGYEEYTWEVAIDIFGETRTGEAPFVTEYTVKETDEGEQTISCRGVINDSDVEFSGADTGVVYVEVVNE